MFLLAGPAVSAPALPSLPVFLGDASGVLETEGVPPITWSTHLSHTKGRVGLSFEAKAKGFEISGEARVDPATLDGTWKLSRFSLDPGVWLPVATEKIEPAALAPKMGKTPPELKKAQDLLQKVKETLREITVTGLVEVSGEGVLQAGKPDGWVSLRWREGGFHYSHGETDITLEGGSAEIRCDGLSPLRAGLDQKLSFGLIKGAGIEMGPGQFVFNLPDEKTLNIKHLEANLFQGQFKAYPFSVALDQPVVDMRARFDGVKLAPLMPILGKAGLAEAKGRLDGAFRLIWSKERDLHSAVFELDPTLPGDAPVVRLSPHEGAMTSHMPKDFEIPGLKSIYRPKNPVYQPLSDIEMGKNSLSLDSLRLLLEPTSTEGHHILRIRFGARTVERTIIPRISLELKVIGPLREILSMGLDSNLTGG